MGLVDRSSSGIKLGSQRRSLAWALRSYRARERRATILQCHQLDCIRGSDRGIGWQNAHTLISAQGFGAIEGGIGERDYLFRTN